jgi:hypothetical protein
MRVIPPMPHCPAMVAISPSLLRGEARAIFDCLLIEAFVSDGAIVALDTDVLVGISQLDVINVDSVHFSP